MDSSEGYGFGTPAHMRHRTTDPKTSKDAAETVDSAKQQMKVFEAIRHFGEDGCISDDLMDFFGFEDQREDSIAYSGITGCYAPLERKFYIERPGNVRKGHRFNKNQLVMYALPDEERERRQRLRDAGLAQRMDWADVELLFKWYEANNALNKARALEQELRSSVVSSLFSDAGYGQFCIPIPRSGDQSPLDHFGLVAIIRPKSTHLKIEKMSERRLRSLQEQAVVADLEQPVFDNGR